MSHLPAERGRDRPWLSAADGVVWLDGNVPAVRFTAHGVVRLTGGRVAAEFPWSQVRELSIKIPSTPGWVSRVASGVSTVLPIPAEHGPVGLHISFEAGYEVVHWRLEQPGHYYSWRLQFLLDDLLRILNHPDRHLAVLAKPQVLDALADPIAGSLRPWARALMYVDLLGLDRYVGGHGTRDRDLLQLVSLAEGRREA